MNRVLQSAVQLKVTIGHTIGLRNVPRNSNSVVTVSKHSSWCGDFFLNIFPTDECPSIATGSSSCSRRSRTRTRTLEQSSSGITARYTKQYLTNPPKIHALYNYGFVNGLFSVHCLIQIEQFKQFVHTHTNYIQIFLLSFSNN